VKRRKRIGVIETGVQLLPRDESGGNLLTGQAVTGVKVGRELEAGIGTKRGNPSPRRCRSGVGPTGERECLKQRNLRGVEYRCGTRGRTVS
jgi:hypothetical protein